ncbi:MAG: pseudaminic acid synthase [Candidatus Marinamargulisbacteria bacterium]|jgi:pseudaminic acid synthase
MKIEQIPIGPNHPPFVIAELSGNHNASLDRALAIVNMAAKSGAHAIKLQTYTADTMTLESTDPIFTIQDPKSLWHGESLYDLYQKAHTPWDWHQPLFERAKALDLVIFSSPFDATSVDFLESLDAPAYKIASFEITDLPLIKRVAETKKPLIMSTGMATLPEIEEAVQIARENGATELCLLKCSSTYPADPALSNLNTIPDLAKRFNCLVGLSDHTPGIGTSIAAVAQGAVIVEKHVTLSRADGGVDSAFSLEPAELTALVKETNQAWQSMGKIQYGPVGAEEKSLRFRRSIFIVEDIPENGVLSEANVKILRPSNGLAPKHFDAVLGRKVTSPLKKGTPLTWDLLQK